MSGSRQTKNGEHDVIYLTPHCSRCIDDVNRYADGLLWCVDKQDPCEDCGKEWIEYHRATRPAIAPGRRSEK